MKNVVFSPEDGNISIFRNVPFSSFFEFESTDKVQNPSNSECNENSDVSV
jgi:hypothetical protein